MCSQIVFPPLIISKLNQSNCNQYKLIPLAVAPIITTVIVSLRNSLKFRMRYTRVIENDNPSSWWGYTIIYSFSTSAHSSNLTPRYVCQPSLRVFNRILYSGLKATNKLFNSEKITWSIYQLYRIIPSECSHWFVALKVVLINHFISSFLLRKINLFLRLRRFWLRLFLIYLLFATNKLMILPIIKLMFSIAIIDFFASWA